MNKEIKELFLGEFSNVDVFSSEGDIYVQGEGVQKLYEEADTDYFRIGNQVFKFIGTNSAIVL